MPAQRGPPNRRPTVRVGRFRPSPGRAVWTPSAVTGGCASPNPEGLTLRPRCLTACWRPAGVASLAGLAGLPPSPAGLAHAQVIARWLCTAAVPIVVGRTPCHRRLGRGRPQAYAAASRDAKLVAAHPRDPVGGSCPAMRCDVIQRDGNFEW